jgi:N-methylhydantoinase B
LSKLVAGCATAAAGRSPDFYVASRAHHADVGGAYAGSMGLCREIYQEGVRIPPVKLMQAGVMNRDILAMLLNNVRTPEEREGDLGAQVAACHTGAERLREVCSRYGVERARRAAAELLDYSEELMRTFLQAVPEGEYRAEDFLDGDGINDRSDKNRSRDSPESVGPGLRPGRASQTRSKTDGDRGFHRQ